jgi:catechol 2,3-dioxygenase-like lactoylglutathione lyase family enzyme
MSVDLPIISGIQQIGIGNTSVYDTWEWYRKNLGMDLPVFDEAAEAALMLPYTEGEPRSRHAILALNMMGGGGAEIWQYTSRVGQPPAFDVQIGDLGLNIAKYKSKNISESHRILKANSPCTEITDYLKDRKHFYTRDPFGNYIEIVESDNWFQKKINHSGGVYGAIIGVTDMEKSMNFYRDILGYDFVLEDRQKTYPDFIPGSQSSFRTVTLTHASPRKGAFSNLLGKSEIELVQCLDRTPNQIFKDRMWGDLGYIHLCFDIAGMDQLRSKCKDYGCPFTVDSGDFDMGEAGGQFAYIEDPDGTLIEFVETHKVPILKKLNWYLHLKNRNPEKSLPRWMLKAMGLNRKKG